MTCLFPNCVWSLPPNVLYLYNAMAYYYYYYYLECWRMNDLKIEGRRRIRTNLAQGHRMNCIHFVMSVNCMGLVT